LSLIHIGVETEDGYVPVALNLTTGDLQLKRLVCALTGDG
jgi:hypothetical protein